MKVHNLGHQITTGILALAVINFKWKQQTGNIWECVKFNIATLFTGDFCHSSWTWPLEDSAACSWSGELSCQALKIDILVWLPWQYLNLLEVIWRCDVLIYTGDSSGGSKTSALVPSPRCVWLKVRSGLANSLCKFLEREREKKFSKSFFRYSQFIQTELENQQEIK